MTTDELRDLALRLAQDASIGHRDSRVGDDFQFVRWPQLEAVVRAAVAHGLRMGAEHVEGMHAWLTSVAVSAALRAKADEMEQSK